MRARPTGNGADETGGVPPARDWTGRLGQTRLRQPVAWRLVASAARPAPEEVGGRIAEQRVHPFRLRISIGQIALAFGETRIPVGGGPTRNCCGRDRAGGGVRPGLPDDHWNGAAPVRTSFPECADSVHTAFLSASSTSSSGVLHTRSGATSLRRSPRPPHPETNLSAPSRGSLNVRLGGGPARMPELARPARDARFRALGRHSSGDRIAGVFERVVRIGTLRE